MWYVGPTASMRSSPPFYEHERSLRKLCARNTDDFKYFCKLLECVKNINILCWHPPGLNAQKVFSAPRSTASLSGTQNHHSPRGKDNNKNKQFNALSNTAMQYGYTMLEVLPKHFSMKITTPFCIVAVPFYTACH